MGAPVTTVEILTKSREQVLSGWVENTRKLAGRTFELMTEAQFITQTQDFADAFTLAIQSSNYSDITKPEYEAVLELLSDISSTRAEQGFTPTETAAFVISFKLSLNQILKETITDSTILAEEVIRVGDLVDLLSIYTFQSYSDARETVVRRQAAAIAFSNPMVRVWDNLISFPLQGILDTSAMKKFTTDMLNSIIENQAKVVIIDLSGIESLDTKTTHYLMNAVGAARLMGSEAVISGISPEVAGIIVALGIDLQVKTFRELREGIEYGFTVLNLKIVPDN